MSKEHSAGVLHADAVYTVNEVKRRFELQEAAFRSLKKRGLPVRRVGRRSYVIGSEAIAFLQSQNDDNSLVKLYSNYGGTKSDEMPNL